MTSQQKPESSDFTGSTIKEDNGLSVEQKLVLIVRQKEIGLIDTWACAQLLGQLFDYKGSNVGWGVDVDENLSLTVWRARCSWNAETRQALERAHIRVEEYVRFQRC